MKHTLLRILQVILFVGINFAAYSQNYTSYFTGNGNDFVSTPSGGICMMGGASESDEAMIWFLDRAARGDVLVLRASGSDGYNNYMYSGLGVLINSVETIVFNNASASNANYIHQRISKAEAIWFAGGDQWDYISYWRGTAIDSLINDGIQNRNIVIGGTSAGMAILGGYYFSAQNGTVTSSTALSNPYHPNVIADSTSFLQNDILSDVITDTHYDDPDRKGRHATFLARIFIDYSVQGKGIACDEYTAVCIDESGIARVFGDYPTYDDNAYFIQTNCDLLTAEPENCSPGNALNWNLGGQALSVYQIKGNLAGSKTFDLNDWKTGSGGSWKYWHVNNGIFNEASGTEPICTIPDVVLPVFEITKDMQVYPNPVWEEVQIDASDIIQQILIYDISAKLVQQVDHPGFQTGSINTRELEPGFYIMRIQTSEEMFESKFIKKR